MANRSKLKICSLFSGIGGFETGIIKSVGEDNCEVVFSSEILPSTAKAYEIIYGEKPFGDITLVNEEDVPDHDLLVAGFPCQSFSFAGKRLGLKDIRGTMFFEVCRIVKHKKPKILLLENVKGLLSDERGQTFETMMSLLSENGYSVSFDILNTKDYGLPQNRERLIIVAIRDLVSEKFINNSRYNSINKIRENFNQLEYIRGFNFKFPTPYENFNVLKSILEYNVEDKYFMKEEVCTSIKNSLELTQMEQIEREILKVADIPKEVYRDNERQRRVYSTNGLTPTILARPDSPKILVVGLLDMKAGKQIRSVYDPDGLSPTIDTAQGGHRQVKIVFKDPVRVRKLTPLECFRAQGFPDEYYYKLRAAGYKDSPLYRMIGNAVSPNVIEAVMNQLNTYID